jgi:hypothetical protein
MARKKANCKAENINSQGFSLVELLVALVFTLFLMMGLAAVFRSSMTSFYTSGENISSFRRNRLSIDQLGEDINMAGMYLTDMSLPPYTVPNMPPFHIRPNVDIENRGDDGQLGTTDELYFYLDEPLPFEGTLLDSSSTSAKTAAEMVLSGETLSSGEPEKPSNNSYRVRFVSQDGAKQIKELLKDSGDEKSRQRVVAIFKDFWEAVEVKRDNLKAEGQYLTFDAGAFENSGITGSGGGSLLASRVSHIAGSSVVFVKPARMIKYAIEMLKLDPNKSEGVPCLVRYHCKYPYNGIFDKDEQPRQIITENVSGFKVYLSVNGGKNWAGLDSETGRPIGGKDFDAGWDADGGIRGQIDAQLKTAGRPGFQTTRGNEHWFRAVPTLVRVDITTRTATKRAESYSDPEEKPVYKELTQTLIFVPRHFGLPMG